MRAKCVRGMFLPLITVMQVRNQSHGAKSGQDIRRSYFLALCWACHLLLDCLWEQRTPAVCPLPTLSYRIHTPHRNPTNKAKQKYNQTSKAKQNKIIVIKQSKKQNPNQSKKQKETKNRSQLYWITSERFLFLCLEGDCSALNAFIGKCLWTVVLKCTDQFWPMGVISSNKATTLLLKLSVLLYPVSLSSQNKGKESC